MLKNQNEFLQRYAAWLEGTSKQYPDFNEKAKSKKKEIRRSLKISDETMVNSFTDTEMAKRIIEHSKPKRGLRIYDGQFQLVEEIMPECKSHRTVKRLKASPIEVIELQRSQNHWRPLMRWGNIDASLAERIRGAIASKAAESTPLTTAQPIIKFFDGDDERDRRMVAWDLEATPNDATDIHSNKFKSYAAGMAWYRSAFKAAAEPTGCVVYQDGDEDMLYVSFWGLDCLEKMVAFLAAHQLYFANSTFYAHNGGKFDLPLVLREHLFQYDGAVIEGEKCTILNGRWIGFQVLFLEHESRIRFRDSVALIAGKLDKLTKEYNVPHQKLAETVDHDDVTLQNWHTFDQLPLYLTHDCLGLLELLDRFGVIMYNEIARPRLESSLKL